VYPSWKQARARLSPPPGAPSYALVIYINKKQKRYYLRVTTIRRVTPHFALFVGTAAFVPGNQTWSGGITNTQGEARGGRERHSEHVHERYR